MKLLSKKEVLMLLGFGTTLGVFVALFLIASLIPADPSNELTFLSPLNQSGPKSQSTTFSLLDYSEKVMSIPIEIHMTKQAKNTTNYEMINVRVSFYTGLARENGGYTELNALGGPLRIGSLAAPPDVPFGSSFIIKNLPSDIQTDTFTVDDRGGAIKWINSHTMKVDVYVKRKAGESDTAYFLRTNDLGIIYTTALYKCPK